MPHCTDVAPLAGVMSLLCGSMANFCDEYPEYSVTQRCCGLIQKLVLANMGLKFHSLTPQEPESPWPNVLQLQRLPFLDPQLEIRFWHSL